MPLCMSPKIQQKLADKDPPVSLEEVEQCFTNRVGKFLSDLRADHKTDPPTQWFIAETDFGRKLKIAFIHDAGNIIIKTAYNPNADELRIYKKYGLAHL